MKFVVGIILIVLLMGALGAYLFLMLNAHDMVYCGDIKADTSNGAYVTRIYTTDLSADETLSEIVLAMNNSDSAAVSEEELTQILATYQNIIYAPVFTVSVEQADTNTFVLSGSVYNGIDEQGQPVSPDFRYKDLGLTLGVANGTILAAQNVYPAEESTGEPAFIEREKVVDPIITDGGKAASFAFRDCDSFRIVLTQTGELPAAVTLAYTYDVNAVSVMDFTGVKDAVFGMTVTVDYDENGVFDPQVKLERIRTAEN